MIVEATPTTTTTTTSSSSKSYSFKAGRTSRSLALPRAASTGAPLGASKKSNGFQTTVVKSTSDPALVQQETVATSSSSPPSSPQAPKEVRFDDIVFRKQVHLDSEMMNPEDIWYSRDELKQSALDIQSTIRKIRVEKMQQEKAEGPALRSKPTMGTPPHPELRGIEDLVCPQSMRSRQVRMKRIIHGVLIEQKRQQASGQANPLLLALQCRHVSTIAQQLAIQRARSDAQEAESFQTPS